jgi:acetylornithine deacetylase/succinyl-diaminopimelate desuccinylase-like protein
MDTALLERLRRHVDRRRLLATAERLVAAPSPTGEAAPALDALAEILAADGFSVERPDGGHPKAPAVAVRFDSRRPGPTLQFNGHLDTVHLPFAPPRVENGFLRGSGASDMKGGTAAAVEALRALRDAEALPAGSVLLTAHDLHEAPWGFGLQLDGLIRAGYVGDAVLLPEPLCNVLPVAGRGHACWKATVRREHPPVHEVMRPVDVPDVIAAGAEIVRQAGEQDAVLAREQDPIAGRSSVFIGQIHAGEIFNGSPQSCWLEGTRRWVPGVDHKRVEREFRAWMERIGRETRTTIDLQYQLIRDAFRLDMEHPFVASFDAMYRTISGTDLPRGSKPFVDDGNCFWAVAGVPAITHGPKAGGQHTTDEWVEIDDLVRVATLYAATAVHFCGGEAAS